ncbi:FtsX-like permease family protein [Thermocatellispora tengchongensis]|uniref:FtsX-like permease family protein n=1 Tax=Thermocatellispora tengchongensis TaxID=1073253 RepID=UPI0036450175
MSLTISLSARSDSYAMPGQEDRETPELTRFGVYGGLERHAHLLSGAWPKPAPSGTVEAVLAQPAARAMRLGTGDEISIEGRLDHEKVRVRVTGVFALDDPFSDRWEGETLLTRGLEIGGYTTYGPLMVPEETFAARFAGEVATQWVAVPDLRGVSPDRLGPLAASVASLSRDAGCPRCTAESRLPEVLAQVSTASLVARSTMLVPVLQLLLLAAYALMLTARLLTEHRRMETALLRSRGAGSARLAALAGAEALIVAIPCALAAPLLAAPLLRAVSLIPWIEASGVRFAPVPDAAAFGVAALVALGCAALLALPALRGARRTYVEEQSARGRGERRGLIQRAGADIALLVVAALAIWQLQRYGGPVTATAGGGLGIDPLIVAGPALALLCGGMLGLRLVPPVSKLAERITSRRPGLAPALGAWQVSRRPLRYSGPALLLTMAVAIGVVSVATAATWRSSQEDQARHRAGADLRVTGSTEGPELGALGRGTAYAALPGVTAISPAFQGTAEFGGTDVSLLALDAARLGELVHLRPDLAADPVATLGARLRQGRPEVGAFPLPGEPGRLTVTARLTVEDGGAAGPYEEMPVRMVLSDGLGVRHEVAVGPLRAGRTEVEIDLAALAGRSGRLTYPLSVRGLHADVPVPPGGSAFTLAIESLRADGAEVPAPANTRWAHRLAAGDHLPAEEVREGDGALVAVGFGAPRDAREGGDPQRLTLVPAAAGLSDEDVFAAAGKVFARLPVVVTEDLAASEKLAPGKEATLTVDRQITRVVVAGIARRLPGTAAERPAVLVDWDTLQTRDLAAGQPPRPATEWWLAVRGGDTAPAAAELRRHPEWDQTVVDVAALTRELRDDPLAGGLQGALILGFLAALVFALLGFLVNAAVAARSGPRSSRSCAPSG